MYKNGANLMFNCFLSIYFHRREASRSILFLNAKTSLYLVIVLARFCLLVDNTKYQLYSRNIFDSTRASVYALFNIRKIFIFSLTSS